MAEVFTSWARPPKGTRKDIIGVRDLPDGRKEYLMHNEALCQPYYLANSGPLHPEVPNEREIGELKKRECATCRDFEANIRGWVEQLGGDVSETHISWELEKLIDKLAAPTESKEIGEQQCPKE